MSPTALLIAGLVAALLIAAGWIGWVWKVRLAQLESAEGLSILSGMRWRELSNLVVDALAASGFERESADRQAARGAATEVHIYRDGRPWILTCRQGLTHVVTRGATEEFARSVRHVNAAGGVVVTPGRVDPGAREFAPNIELLDGHELWRLVGPLLPASVLGEVTSRARARALRATGTALAAAVVGGILVGYGLGHLVGVVDDAPPEPVAAAAATPARAATRVNPSAAPAARAPMSEDEEREAIVHAISQLPGVDRVGWSTRSTLQVLLNNPDVANDAALCAVMKRYELLRASRLQIQAPAGSSRPVRFMQCAVY